jgi:hypothetical protein
MGKDDTLPPLKRVELRGTNRSSHRGQAGVMQVALAVRLVGQQAESMGVRLQRCEDECFAISRRAGC